MGLMGYLDFSTLNSSTFLRSPRKAFKFLLITRQLGFGEITISTVGKIAATHILSDETPLFEMKNKSKAFCSALKNVERVRPILIINLALPRLICHLDNETSVSDYGKKTTRKFRQLRYYHDRTFFRTACKNVPTADYYSPESREDFGRNLGETHRRIIEKGKQMRTR